ncbi:MAG: PEP-CTERM sorting domain-containing protein [Phycisphaerae bacterium]|nr:PEP-CTERM sorting domain-containing protein [Phycisphaerae bacterium]
MRKQGIALAVLLSIGLILSSPALAVQHVDDYEYAKPSQDTFTHGIFQHNITPISGNNNAYWDFYEMNAQYGDSLCLWPARDEITFDLGAGEFVDFVSIDFIDWTNGETTVEVIGTKNTYTMANPNSVWLHADTSGKDLGNITKIRFFSYEGAFDNLTVNVTPEPASIFLLGIGGLAFRFRTKR